MRLNFIIILMLAFTSTSWGQAAPYTPEVGGTQGYMQATGRGVNIPRITYELDHTQPDEFGTDRTNIKGNFNFDSLLTLPSLTTTTPADFGVRFGGSDSDVTPCPSCDVPSGVEAQAQALAAIALPRDCSCKAQQYQSSDRKILAQGLAKVCECYFAQDAKLLPTLSAQQKLDQYRSTIGKMRGNVSDKITGLVASLVVGPAAQSILLGVNTPAPEIHNGPTRGDTTTDQALTLSETKRSAYIGVVRVAGPVVPVPSIDASAVSRALPTVSPVADPSRTPAQLAQALMDGGSDQQRSLDSLRMYLNDTAATRTPEQCVSRRQYIEFKQIPKPSESGNNNPFYGFLASARKSKNFDVKEWRISSLLKNYKDSVNAFVGSGKVGSIDLDPQIAEYKERIKFLFANPIYANLFESNSAGAEKYQKQLAGNIIENFYPSSCRTNPISDCAYSPAAVTARRKSDLALFGQPEVKDIVDKQGPESIKKYIKPYLENPYAFQVPNYENLTKQLITNTPQELGREKIVKLCNISEYGASSFKGSPQAPNQNTEGDYRVEELFLEAGQDSTMVGEDSGFAKFVADMCSTPRCKAAKQGSEDWCREPGKTFADFYKVYSNTHNCSRSGTLDCWSDAQKKYFEDYPLVASDGFATFSGDGLSFNSFLGGEHIPSKKEVEGFGIQANAVAAAPSSGVVALTPSITSDGYRSYDLTPSYAPTPQSSQRKSLSSAFPDDRPTTTSPSASTVATTTSTADFSRSADVPIGRSPASTASTGPVYAPFVNVPTPAEIPQITAEAQVARTESNQLESQANALASVRSVTTDPTAKSTLDAQIAALTERANAADAKASALEAQLKAAERSARTPGSTTAGAAANPGQVDSSSSPASGSARTNVTSAVTNPVAVPQSQSQVQAQSGFQSFGSGSGSVSVPLSTGASTSGSSKKNYASNFSFKYGSDARIDAGTNGAPSIIVSGASSAFTATQDLAQAVDRSPIVPIKDVITNEEAGLLVNYDIDTIRKYVSRSSSPIKPGPFRLTFTYGNGQKGEIVGMMNENGQAINFPRMKSLAQLRTQLGSVSNH